MHDPVNVSIVVPCYNEEAVLAETAAQLSGLLDEMIQTGLASPGSAVVFVDDGSKDSTWQIISDLCVQSNRFSGIKLARNAGHQNALLAGLLTVRDTCDCAVSIDADLQDDIRAIPEMLKKFLNGSDIVYGVRSNRDTDTKFKRGTAVLFYKFMRAMGVNLVFNHADYRLMSRRALEAFSQFSEVNLFLRGIVPLVGFPSDTVYYKRRPRFAGESKYPLKKMLSFAFDGITSFSIAPIRLISALGVAACLISIAMAVYALVVKATRHAAVGWASLMVSIWFLGGVQLISVGVIGEYIGKIYKEVKRRPRFIIEACKNIASSAASKAED